MLTVAFVLSLSTASPLAADLRADPELAYATDLRVAEHHFGSRVVSRITPIIDGVLVEGADRIVVDGVTDQRHLAPLAPHGSFAILEGNAIANACAAIAGCLFTDPNVEDLHGFAIQRWLARDDGAHASWRVRVPTLDLRDMRDVWIDAETGAVLKSQPTVTFVAAPTKANVFIGDQPSSPTADLSTELEEVDLEELDAFPVGGNLRGEHFETFNCCKHFICNDGTADCITRLNAAGGNPDNLLARDVATCAAATDPGPCNGTACASNVDLAVAKADIPFPLPIQGDTLFARVAFCAELPRAASAAAAGPNGEDGWFFTPVDKDVDEDPQAAAASEEDAFAEVEAYHSTFVYFQHVRQVLGDSTFCLGPNSMNCDGTGASVLDGTSGLPVHPFHITTNVLFPALNLQALAAQIIGGHGASANDPVIVSDFQRIPNAAFVPALSGGPIQIPPELAVLAQLFQRPFDSNVYFQGHRDFAYDGDVVHHEFTHGVVHKFNPNLAVNGVDEYGTHVEPGALNEGWADYMSSSFAGNPQVGEYASAGLVSAGETGLRDNDNTKKCPDDLIGEVHGDSEPWAGVLWATRTSLNGDQATIDAFDKAVLAAIAASQPDETFATAGQHLVDAIKADASLGQTVADFAQSQLDTRALSGCVRVWPLSDLNADETGITTKPVPQLFQPGKQDVGLTNFAPALFQLKVVMPAKSPGFTLSWGQAAGGLGLSQTNAGIDVMVHEITGAENGRIHWAYAGGVASATDDAGAAIAFDVNNAANKASVGTAVNGVSPGTFTQTFDSTCAARTFIVDILSPDAAAVLTNIDVKSADLATLDCNPVGPGKPGAKPTCGCQGSGDAAPLGMLAVALTGLALRRRRRRG